MKKLLPVLLLASLTGPGLLAGVTYDQTNKFTGGSLIDMTRAMANNPMMARMGGRGMGAAFRDQIFHVYVQGSKMARIGDTLSVVTDLDAETITTIFPDRKVYTVETFDQIRERNARFNRGQGDPSFDVHVDHTGKTRSVDGRPASEVVTTMTAKSASDAGAMVIKMDSWIVPATSASREANDFSKRLVAKLNSGLAVGGGPAAAGMGAAFAELLKLDGYPALTDMEISGIAAPGPMGGSGGDPSKPALTMETQSSNFASATVDDSKFAIPAGYTQEQPRGGPGGRRRE